MPVVGWAEVIAYAFKLIGQLIDLKAQNQLTRAQLDAAVALLKPLPPPS